MFKSAQFLNHSNVLVAAAAAAMSAEVQLLTFGFLHPSYILLAFTSTFCGYTFLKRDHPFDNIHWKRAAATMFLLNLFLVSSYSIIFLIAAAVIVLFYSPQFYPEQIKFRGYHFRRNIFLKTISIATSWILITAILPITILTSQNNIVFVNATILVTSFWMLTAGLSIAGDLRDATIDRNKLNTWPISIGLLNTRILVIVLLILSALLLVLATSIYTTVYLITVIFLTMIICFSIMLIDPQKSWHYQTAWIDGFIILHSVAIYFAMNA